MAGKLTDVFAAEWLKARRRKMTFVLPVLCVVLSVMIFFGLDLAARRQWVGVPTGFFIASSTISWMINVLALLTVILTSFHISQEFALGTIKQTWVRPVPRGTWFRAKIITAAGGIAVLFGLVVGTAVILSAVGLGFADLMEKDYLVHTAGALGGRFVLSCLLTLWSLLTVTVVIAVLGSFFNHPGGTIAVGLGVSLVMTGLAIFPALQPLLLSTYLSLPAEYMVGMSKGLPLRQSWGEVTRLTLIGGGIWMIVSLAIGHWWIQKKEIRF